MGLGRLFSHTSTPQNLSTKAVFPLATNTENQQKPSENSDSAIRIALFPHQKLTQDWLDEEADLDMIDTFFEEL